MQNTLQNISILEIENNLSLLVEDYCEFDNINVTIKEVKTIGDSLIESKRVLSQLSSVNNEKSLNLKKMISHIPVFGNVLNKKIESTEIDIDRGKTAKEILQEIFGSLDSNRTRLIQYSESIEVLKEKLFEKEKKLQLYLDNLKNIDKNTLSSSEKLKVLNLSTTIRMHLNVSRETIYNQIIVLEDLIERLNEKINATLPIVKNAISDSLQILGTVNALKDSLEIMNTIERISNDIMIESTNSIHSLIKDVHTSLTNSYVSIDFLENSIKRNKEFSSTLKESRKQFLESSIEKYDRLEKISGDLQEYYLSSSN